MTRKIVSGKQRVVYLLLLAISACSQGPVDVEYKGQNNYTRNDVAMVASNTYSNNANRSYTTPASAAQSTEASAAVQPIGVNDLSTTPPKPKPQPAVKPAPAPALVASQPAKVNPWTNQPHFSETTVTDIPPPAPAVAVQKPDNAMDKTDNPQPVVDDSPKPAPVEPAKVAAPKPAPVKAETQMANASDAQSSFIWPVADRKILSGFGPKGNGKTNDGINIASADGEPVWAVADGEVIYVGDGLKGYGTMVLIKHAGSKSTSYAHLSRAAVDKYDRVKQGQIIGYVGSSGDVKEPQLHFSVRNGKEPVDPAKYLTKNTAG